MDLENLILQLAEKIEDSEEKSLFLETIEELGEEVTVDDVLTIFENIGDVNNELDSNSAEKALQAFGLSGQEGEGASPLHKKLNDGPKSGQEASHNTAKTKAVEDDSEDTSLAPYAKKLNAAASAKVKALKPNDKALPEETEEIDESSIYSKRNEKYRGTGKKYNQIEWNDDNKVTIKKKRLKDTEKRPSHAVIQKRFDKTYKEMEESFDFTEDINALFEGTELSEEFKEKALLIFESSVASKINEHIDYLYEEVEAYFEEVDEAVGEIINEEVELFKEEAMDTLDKYLDYIVEEFLEENAVAIESGIKVEIAESIFEGFKNLLSEHNIDVTEQKLDLVDEVIEENESLVESYNREVEKVMDLSREIKELKKEKLIKELTEDLTAIEAEKFAKLVEGVEYSDDDSFINKVNILAEAYAPSEKSTVKTLAEEYYEDDVVKQVSVSSDVQGVLRSLDKFAK